MHKDLVLEACRLDIKSRVVRHSTGCTAKQCSLCNPRLWSTGTAHQRGDHTSFLRSEDNASAPSMTSQSHVADSFRMQGRKEGRKEGRNGRKGGRKEWKEGRKEGMQGRKDRAPQALKHSLSLRDVFFSQTTVLSLSRPDSFRMNQFQPVFLGARNSFKLFLSLYLPPGSMVWSKSCPFTASQPYPDG